MKTKTTKTSGIKVTANVKAGGFAINHSRAGLRVKAGIVAGATPMQPNHSAILLAIR